MRNNKEKQKNFLTGAVILGAAGLLVKVIGAFFRIPLANSIGSIGMSYYEVAYPYYSWLLVISSSGFPTAISKMVSERVSLGHHAAARRVFRISLVLLVGIGLVTSFIMYYFAGQLAALSTFESAELCFKALAPALFIVSIICAYRGYLQGLQRMTGTALSQITEQLVKLAAGLTLAIRLLPKGPEYAAMGALIGVTISEFVALIVIIVYYYKQKRWIDAMLQEESKPEPMGALVQKLLVIAIPITIGASISPLAGVVDSALIGRILADLGFLEEAAQTAFSLLRTNVTTLINMPSVLTMALAMSLVPAISASMAERNFKSVRAASMLGLKLSIWIGLPCSIGLFLLAEPVLTLLYTNLSGSELQLATELLRTASVGVLFLSLVQTMTGVIQGMGKPNVPVFNLLIGFVLKVITMLVLMRIPSINIQGAAVSTVVCYAFTGLADTVYVLRQAKLGLPLKDAFLKPLIASVCMGLTVYLLRSLMAALPHQSIITLLCILVAVIVYVILSLVLRVFTGAELAMVPGGRRITALLNKKR